ncbi:hypothetical protein [Natroniella sulfidigena]|nr:hypothetical protein [Natroniella sulfidigena]
MKQDEFELLEYGILVILVIILLFVIYIILGGEIQDLIVILS